MIERRHYPPIVTFHAPGCWMFLGNAPALPVDEAREKFPNHQFDMCAAAEITPYVMVEEHDFGPHLWQPSEFKPDDAIRSLCRRCKSTHGEDDEREVITVKAEPKPTAGPRLILPSNVQTNQTIQP